LVFFSAVFLYSLILSCLLFIISSSFVLATPLECIDLGFTPTLICSRCTTLQEFVNDKELQEECLRCCASDKSDDNTRWPYATIKVDRWRHFFFPKVEQFLKERAEKFVGLKIKNRSGVFPTLSLEDETHHVVETVSIESWDPDTIEDFLKEKLIDGTGKDRSSESTNTETVTW